MSVEASKPLAVGRLRDPDTRPAAPACIDLSATLSYNRLTPLPARRHSQLALRLLEATPGKQRQGLLASADADGRTLLHLVVASQDAALVKELMKQAS